MLTTAYSFQELFERSCNVRSCEWFRDQHHFLGVAGTQAGVGFFRGVADDDDGKLS